MRQIRGSATDPEPCALRSTSVATGFADGVRAITQLAVGVVPFSTEPLSGRLAPEPPIRGRVARSSLNETTNQSPVPQRSSDEVPDTQHHDVVVVGATLRRSGDGDAARRAGHDVLLLDRARSRATRSRPTRSPGAAWSSSTAGACCRPCWRPARRPSVEVVFHGAARRSSGRSRTAAASTCWSRLGVTCSTPLLVDAAVDAGARLVTGVTVDGVRRADDGRVTGVRGRSGDGRVDISGPVRRRRRRAGLAHRPRRSTRVHGGHAATGAARRTTRYFAGDWPAMEYHLGDGCSPESSRRTTARPASGCALHADEAERYRRLHHTLDAAFGAMVRAAAPELAARIGPTRIRTSRTRE